MHRNDVPAHDSLAADLARRRAATDRLPPLADGTRDPLLERGRRTPPRVLHVAVDRRWRRALVKTRDRPALSGLLTRLAIPAAWSKAHGGYGIDAHLVPDLDAAAQHAGWVVRIKDRADAA